MKKVRKQDNVSRPDVRISDHAWQRMSRRGVVMDQIMFALQWGKRYHVGKALEYVVGRKVLQRAKKYGASVPKAEGLHVVVSKEDGKLTVVTVYKNRDMKRVKRHSEKRFYAC